MPRKGENIFKRKDGRWEGRYIKGRDLSNKAIYGYLYGKTYTEVKKKLEQKKMKNPDCNVPCLKFSQLAREWLENKKLCVKESTLAQYNTVIDKHILPLLGNYDVSAVSSNVVGRYMNRILLDGYAVKTASDVLNVIKGIMKFAERKGYCNFCDLDIVTLKTYKPEADVLSQLEQKRLCDYLLDNLNSKNFGILLCLYTGLRIGELCALKWSDIDIKERVVYVNKTMLRIKEIDSSTDGSKTKLIVTPPKSENSDREIPIPNFIIKIIKDFRRNSGAYVLTNSTDNFIEPRNMQYYFKTVLKKCEIRNVKFHTLRHTFATRCVEYSFDIKSLSEILGHSSIRITLDRYVHSSMDLKRKNMDKLNFLSA